jgi:hypothetical protein
LIGEKEHKLATTVYDIIEIELQDGAEISLRPLKIKVLREFMKTFQSMAETDIDEDDSMGSVNLILDCVQVAMKQYAPEYAVDREKLEDAIDLPTAYKIIEVASGIKLNDPNLVAAALVGTN